MESIIETMPYMSKIKEDSVTANNFTLCGSHHCLFSRNKLPWVWFLTTSDVADAAINSVPGVNCNFLIHFHLQKILHGESLISYSLCHKEKFLHTNGQLSYSNMSFSLLHFFFKQTFHPQFCEYKVAAVALLGTSYLGCVHKTHYRLCAAPGCP